MECDLCHMSIVMNDALRFIDFDGQTGGCQDSSVKVHVVGKAAQQI